MKINEDMGKGIGVVVISIIVGAILAYMANYFYPSIISTVPFFIIAISYGTGKIISIHQIKKREYQRKMKEFKEKLSQWKSEGYDVSELEEMLK
ncbi:hypothetical protein DRP07_02765 [Archaeoglobales archaeon]|nr:MAG: hypothetical protein DRP07_02765 [Archaeoglobales archaeon]